jgi:hypothetical protein
LRAVMPSRSSVATWDAVSKSDARVASVMTKPREELNPSRILP